MAVGRVSVLVADWNRRRSSRPHAVYGRMAIRLPESFVGFLEAHGRGWPRWRARRVVWWAEKFKFARGVRAVVVLASRRFLAQEVCAFSARLLKARFGENAAALGVRAREHHATIESRLVLF